MSSRVFVLEPTEYSLAKAKLFGELVFLYGDEDAHPPWMTNEFIESIRDRLEELSFNEKVDYVAVSGRMMSVSVFVAIAAQAFQDVKLLCFDHDKEVRRFRVIDLSSVERSKT